MKSTLDPRQAKDWFGTAPPDLSVIARSRAEAGKGSGADYLYTLWRTFYRDDASPTGWNNLAFPNIAMPHVLWQLQGERRARLRRSEGPARRRQDRAAVRTASSRSRPAPSTSDSTTRRSATWSRTCSGWASRRRGTRVRVGVGVLLFLGLLVVITWRLNAAFWKDVN